LLPSPSSPVMLLRACCCSASDPNLEIIMVSTSDADPDPSDPNDFGPPRSGFISQRYLCIRIGYPAPVYPSIIK
jgi:hypothetical protein